MTLVKTSILSAISTVIKLISGFLVTKVIAVYVGPAGLALVGQLQNFVNIILMFAGGFLKTATTKYTAEYAGDEHKKYNSWSSSIFIIFILNICIFIVLYYFADEWSNYLLHSTQYSYILKVLAFSIPFFVLNTMMLSILNGQRQIQKFIFLNISLSIVSLILVVTLSIKYGVDGALIGYVTNQSVVFVITLIAIKNETWFNLKNFLLKPKSSEVKKLLGFAMITLSAVLFSNISLIYVRDYIVEILSLKEAGYWQGVWALSQVSLTLITMSLTTYFLPTISALKLKQEISKELKKVILFAMPIAVVIALGMYLFRELIISILYTEEFMPMKELFLWQMIGNIFKVLGWIFGYVLVAKAMVKYTVFGEIVFAITFIIISMLCVKEYGLVGMTYTYTLNNILYLIYVVAIYKLKLKEVNV